MGTTWVFHRGSLGDSVLLWPALRGLMAAGERVALVTDGAKARLAARELGVEPHDAEQRRFNQLWIDGAPVEPIPGVTRVLWIGGDDMSAAGRTWIASAQATFPGASIHALPGRLDRPAALALASRFAAGPPLATPRVAAAHAPTVFHVGAGAEIKRWPLEHWRSLAAAVGPVITIAGEVESDRFNHEDRAAFESLGGRFIESLDTLADTIRPARLFVGADTGPTHLAAALGVPTVALFGPTDPDRWGPIGPSVSTIKSAKGRMDSLSAGEVVRAIADVLVR